jgi:hypothetical protein
VKGPDGGIGGVYSLSEDKPMKVAGFRQRDASLAGAQKYSDWKFSYAPSAQPAAAKPAAGATPPGATPAPPAAAAPAPAPSAAGSAP